MEDNMHAVLDQANDAPLTSSLHLLQTAAVSSAALDQPLSSSSIIHPTAATSSMFAPPLSSSAPTSSTQTRTNQSTIKADAVAGMVPTQLAGLFSPIPSPLMQLYNHQSLGQHTKLRQNANNGEDRQIFFGRDFDFQAEGEFPRTEMESTNEHNSVQGQLPQVYLDSPLLWQAQTLPSSSQFPFQSPMISPLPSSNSGNPLIEPVTSTLETICTQSDMAWNNTDQNWKVIQQHSQRLHQNQYQHIEQEASMYSHQQLQHQTHQMQEEQLRLIQQQQQQYWIAQMGLPMSMYMAQRQQMHRLGLASFQNVRTSIDGEYSQVPQQSLQTTIQPSQNSPIAPSVDQPSIVSVQQASGHTYLHNPNPSDNQDTMNTNKESLQGGRRSSSVDLTHTSSNLDNKSSETNGLEEKNAHLQASSGLQGNVFYHPLLGMPPGIPGVPFNQFTVLNMMQAQMMGNAINPGMAPDMSSLGPMVVNPPPPPAVASMLSNTFTQMLDKSLQDKFIQRTPPKRYMAHQVICKVCRRTYSSRTEHQSRQSCRQCYK